MSQHSRALSCGPHDAQTLTLITLTHAVWFEQCAAAADGRSAKVAEDAVTFLKDGHRALARRSLVLPEIAEPLGRKFAISNRMLDVLVAEIVLQRPSIHALIGQLEPS